MGAVLLWVRGDLSITTTELSKFDGFMGKHGDNFHNSVQTAFDAKKPCMLFIESRPDIMCNDRQLNPDGWEVKEGECYDLDLAVNDVFVSGWTGQKTNSGKRAIHGIVIDISKAEDLSGKKLSAEWFAGYSEWLMNAIFKATGLPIYIYIGQGIINEYNGEQVYTGNDLITIQTFIERVANISTVDFTSAIEDDGEGIPMNKKPVLPYDNSATVPWYFWLFKYISSGKYKIMFNGDVDAFHAELGYSPTENSDSTDENGGSDNDSTVIDTTSIVGAINALTAAFIGFVDWLKGKFGG